MVQEKVLHDPNKPVEQPAVRLKQPTTHIMLKEFKEFAFKGNLIDMGVAFVMGAAFTKFTTSFLDDLFMPFVAKIMQGKDFSQMFLPLFDTAGKDISTLAKAKALGPVVTYGNFITITISFIITAFVMFLIVKAANKFKKAEAAAPAAPPVSEVLLAEIRDLLKK